MNGMHCSSGNVKRLIEDTADETLEALHAPQNVDWRIIRDYPWNNDEVGVDGSTWIQAELNAVDHN